MKLYLDDVRIAPTGWIQVFTIEEAKELLANNKVAELSLDHDLGDSYLCETCKYQKDLGHNCFESCCLCACHTDPAMPTGYDLVRWMVLENVWPVYKPIVHSANPDGRARMQHDIDRYWHPPKERQ